MFSPHGGSPLADNSERMNYAGITVHAPPILTTAVLLVTLSAACRSPDEPEASRDSGPESIEDHTPPASDTDGPLDSGVDTADTAMDTGDPRDTEAPCDTPRQAWPSGQLDGHTPWFLTTGERVLLGTVHDTEAAHILQLVDDELIDLGAPAETETAIWQIVELDGEWYAGTYPHAHLLREGVDLGSLWDGASSAYSLAAASGWVYAGLGPERAALASYSVETGEVRIFEGTGTAAYGEVHLGSDGQVYGELDGESYQFTEGDPQPVSSVIEADTIEWEGLQLEQVRIDEPASLQLSVQLRDPDTWEPLTTDLPIEGRGLTLHAVGAVDGRVVGGTILPNEIFTLEDGALNHQGHVGDGEMYSILAEEDATWMAEYPSGDLWRYDPSAPWELGQNPAVTELGEGHLRPLALEAGMSGEIWVGSVAGYGVSGGALARVRDGVVSDYRTPFEEIGVSALAWDEATGWLVVAADGIWLWSPDEERVAHTLEITTPWVMETIDGILYAMTWEMELMVIDLATRQVLHQQASGLGHSRRHSLQLSHGLLWGVSDSAIYTIDPDTYSVTVHATSPLPIDISGAQSEGKIYFGSGASLWSFDLESSTFTEIGEPVEAADIYDFGTTSDDVVALLKAGDTLSVLSVALCEPDRSKAIELLENGDFELGISDWEDWGGDWGEASSVSHPVRSGSAALQLTAGSRGGYAFQTVDPSLEGEVAAGVWVWLPSEGAPERIQFELWLYGLDTYAWGRTEIDVRDHPREEWVLLGPFGGTIDSGFTESYVHIGVLGESGDTAFFDDLSMRRFE
jgi:hypothetical protein